MVRMQEAERPEAVRARLADPQEAVLGVDAAGPGRRRRWADLGAGQAHPVPQAGGGDRVQVDGRQVGDRAVG